MMTGEIGTISGFRILDWPIAVTRLDRYAAMARSRELMREYFIPITWKDKLAKVFFG